MHKYIPCTITYVLPSQFHTKMLNFINFDLNQFNLTLKFLNTNSWIQTNLKVSTISRYNILSRKWNLEIIHYFLKEIIRYFKNIFNLYRPFQNTFRFISWEYSHFFYENWFSMTVANFNFQDTKISILMFDLQFVIVITYDWREREKKKKLMLANLHYLIVSYPIILTTKKLLNFNLFLYLFFCILFIILAIL